MQISHLIKQKSYEKIEFVLRRHWLTFIPYIIQFLVLSVIPLVVGAMALNLYPDLFADSVWFAIGVVLGSIYYLSLILFFFAHFIDFYLDVWIVTNDRIIDMEQFGLFSRTISEVDLFQIQDVTTDVHGPLATLFNYGDVQVKTASLNNEIVFRAVHRPNKIRESLIRFADVDRKFHRQ